MSNDQEIAAERWREAVRAVLTTVPTGYASKREAMKCLSQIFLEELGNSLQPALADEASRLNEMPLRERRQWASACNEDLRELHLTLRCPKTARPATLIVDSAGGEAAQARYRLQIYQQGRAIRTYTGKALPELTIIPDDSRIESLAHRGRGIGGSEIS